jgi:Ca2+-binding EF-hand superfamily protein
MASPESVRSGGSSYNMAAAMAVTSAGGTALSPSSPLPSPPRPDAPTPSGNAAAAAAAGAALIGRRQPTHSTLAELSEAFRMLGTETEFTPKDLVRLMTAAGQHPTDDDGAEVVKSIDQASGGSISFNEFASLMGRSAFDSADEVDALAVAFWGMDKARTGKVTSAQFIELFALYGEKSDPEEAEEMLHFADPNGTGVVEYMPFLRTLGLRLK